MGTVEIFGKPWYCGFGAGGPECNTQYPQPPAPPDPASATQVPGATAGTLTAWTPNQAAAYDAANWQKYQGDLRDFFDGVSAHNPPAEDNPAPQHNNTLLWILSAVAGVLFLQSIARR